ncbi:MAG: response regulator [Deltaproteobacteria bacterium]|nr:response regulator [Deltaproteobacteria bacterium]
MIKKVLFVDDDRILCRKILKKLERYKKRFTILTAADGLDAVDKMKEKTISLVITDLQMPKWDGFALMAYLSEEYPDIPVIVQTAHSTPKAKKIALSRGAAGYIEKPYNVDDLGQKIIATLKKESEGGILQSIPLEMFIQLIEMEQKTCTIRVVEKKSGKHGVLFFKNGDLLDARISSLHGKSIAYEIFSWNEVTLSIQDECAVDKKRIDGDLQAILFEAIRLKDEAAEKEELEANKKPATIDQETPEAETDRDDTMRRVNGTGEIEKPLKEKTDPPQIPATKIRELRNAESDSVDAIRLENDTGKVKEALKKKAGMPKKVATKDRDTERDRVEPEPKALSLEENIQRTLESAMGGKKYLKDIYPDNSWSNFILRASEIGKHFTAGSFKSCYIDKGQTTDFVILPCKEITVISVDPRCPRDRFLQALSG